MTPEEANKIIAEFMGGPYIGDACNQPPEYVDVVGKDWCTKDHICKHCKDIPKYYLSLDALVPVWEKLWADLAPWVHIQEVSKIMADIYGTTSNNIFENATIATAKIIREDENKDEEDPTPWCHVCGSMTSDKCDCGPIADNN